MIIAMNERAPVAEVEAALRYTVRTGEKPISETYGPGGPLRKVTGTFSDQVVRIRNGRLNRVEFHLDTNGFEFLDQPTQMRDFFDHDALRAVYYPEMEKLIAEVSGATRVHVFDHTLRSGDEATREARRIREPVKTVHNDYTEWSAPQRIRDFFPEQAETLLKWRFAIIQVWRAINRPIDRDPLAIADSRSLYAKDFIAVERRFPDRIGEIYQLEFNPTHRWHWFPRMSRDEALVFKTYDSATDGRARFSAHTSFDDPASPGSAEPRESVEIRAFAFFALI